MNSQNEFDRNNQALSLAISSADRSDTPAQVIYRAKKYLAFLNSIPKPAPEKKADEPAK